MSLNQSPAVLLTVVLSATAGFCDTLTYTRANSLFSAHVTGNFILFATNIITDAGNMHDAWVRLLTFPVFIVAVIAGGWIGERSINKHFLILLEGLLLTITGVVIIGLKKASWLVGFQPHESFIYLPALFIVAAMGIQNAFGKLFAAATFGPTTMMTGNVAQWSLDLLNFSKSAGTNKLVLSSFKNISVTIGSFLAGCMLGAVAGLWAELGAVVFPGIILLLYYYFTVALNTSSAA